MSHTLSSRPSKPEDLNLVYDTWLQSWRTSPWAGCIPNHLYYDTQRSTIAGLLERGAQIRVAHFEGSPDLIQGWCCYEYKDGVTILHYIYARDSYMADALSEHFRDTALGPTGLITHQQKNRTFKRWKHCPEIARRKRL